MKTMGKISNTATTAKTIRITENIEKIYKNITLSYSRNEPIFGQRLTDEAVKYNAPRHFGENIETDIGGNGTEILPVKKPKVRRAKARRIKA